MRTGEGQNLSTFGAIGEKPKAGNLYLTFEWQFVDCNLGGNADTSVPYSFGMEVFLLEQQFKSTAGAFGCYSMLYKLACNNMIYYSRKDARSAFARLQ